MPKNKKILFVLNGHKFTSLHRLPLIKFLKNDGNDIVCALPNESEGAIELRKNNVKIINWEIERKDLGLLNEMKSIFQLYKIYNNEKPYMTVNSTIKPVIYGSIASRVASPKIKVINLITGLGSTFIANKIKDKFLRSFLRMLYHTIFMIIPQKVIFQNHEDMKMLVNKKKYTRTKMTVIPGSGVNILKFQPSTLPKEKNASFIGRIIKEKGVDTFISAANIIREKRKDINFFLFGPLDKGNPSSIDIEQIFEWQNQNLVKWDSNVNDIKLAYTQSRIICLPSLREGMSKVLMEAGLCERVVIASNVPGCKEIVSNNFSGFLIDANDDKGLAEIILEIINNDKKLKKMGKFARNYIIDNFSEEIIIPKLVKFIDS